MSCVPSKPLGKVEITRMAFLDADVLQGGMNVYVDTKGNAFCQVFRVPGQKESGTQESRYMVVLQTDEVDSLTQLMEKSELRSISIEHRPGKADEFVQTLIVHTASGPEIVIKKLERQKDTRLDAIQTRFTDIGRQIVREGRVVYAGVCQPKWRPAGW